MTVAIQIRDVPDEVRNLLAAQAAARGQSMQSYLLGVISREARLGATLDLFSATADIRIDLDAYGFDPVAIIREGREGGFEVDRDEFDPGEPDT
jgi:hypothetical protein